jgi:pyruvate-formate lyase
MTLEDSDATPKPSLTEQDVYEVLKDITLKRRTMKRACAQSWDEIFSGLFHIKSKVGTS